MMTDRGRNDGEGGRCTDSPAPFAVEVDGGFGSVRIDDIFAALTDGTRRFVLYYLREHELVTVDELAGAVAAHEKDVPLETVSTAERERVAVELLHNHLPRLEDARFIEYDQLSRTIRATELPPLMEKIIGLLAEIEDGRTV